MDNAPPAADLLVSTTSSQSVVVVSNDSGSASTVVTVLPGSPTDGQRVILTDSVSAPTYAWELVYVASASEWLFVGGSPLQGFSLTSNTRASGSTTYADPANNVSLVVPRAGVYKITWSAIASRHASVSGSSGHAVALNIAGSIDSNTEQAIYLNANTDGGLTTWPIAQVYRTGTLVASATIKFQFKAATDSALDLASKSISVVPVTVT